MIITLGLAEVRRDTLTDTFPNIVPVKEAFRHHPDRHEFRVTSSSDNMENLERLYTFLTTFGHPQVQIIVTVSPCSLDGDLLGRQCRGSGYLREIFTADRQLMIGVLGMRMFITFRAMRLCGTQSGRPHSSKTCDTFKARLFSTLWICSFVTTSNRFGWSDSNCLLGKFSSFDTAKCVGRGRIVIADVSGNCKGRKRIEVEDSVDCSINRARAS